jgi:hypothetical protein
MPTDQADEYSLLIGVPPVVNRLITDAVLLTNRGRMFAFAQH